MAKISNDWSGTGVPETGLKVDYPEICAMYGLEEVQAVVEAMQGPIYTLSTYTKKFQEEFARFARRAAGQWRPPAGLSMACGVLVLLLELPCFWYCIAMGISMGWAVQGGTPYQTALASRAPAYASVIVPLLLVSALAESVTIRTGAEPAEDEPA